MIRKDIKDFNTNIFEEFPKMCLLTAGDYENRNSMTISWGLMGTLWNKPVVIVAVRPTRHTFHLMEESDRFTLSFMSEKYKNEVTFMGRTSGRNIDKYKETGLVPVYDNDSFVSYIKDSEYVFKCKKIYSSDLKEDSFIDKSLLSHYDLNIKDYHKIYIAEVTSLLVKEE